MSDTYIISIYYSQYEKRIGSVNNDYSLSFWEDKDHFTFENSLFYNYDYLHNQIFFLEQEKVWMTVDLGNGIHVWDIMTETTKMFPRVHMETIICIKEIMFLKLVAISSIDKLVLWDPKTRTPHKEFKIKLENDLSAQNMVYKHDFQILAISSFDPVIKLYCFKEEAVVVGLL